MYLGDYYLDCYSASSSTAYNRRVSGSGFQSSPKSPSATSETRNPVYDMAGEVKLKEE